MRHRALLLIALDAILSVVSRAHSLDALASPPVALSTQQWVGSGASPAPTSASNDDPRRGVLAPADLAGVYLQQGDLERARRMYELSLQDRPLNGEVLMKLGLLSFALGEKDRAAPFYQRALALNASLAIGWEHDIALAYHYVRDYAAAESYYRRVADVSSAPFHFNFGVTLERRGKILEAAAEYNRALEINPAFAEAWLNIAALHHLHGDVSMSISRYERVIELSTASPSLRLMAMTNVGVAYELVEQVRSAMLWYAHGLELLPFVPFKDEDEAIVSKLALLAHIGRAKKTAADWSDADTEFNELWDLVRTHMVAFNRPSALLPFDTLLYPMDPMDRKQVAMTHSSQFKPLDRDQEAAASDARDQRRSLGNGRLHIGFLSYDFSDHPTTHLMEGVFTSVDRSQSMLIAFGYGRDDGSESRRRIVSAADKFVNMAATSFEESAKLIHNEHIHILMDAQGHTRGGRMKIAALRPAPVIVNYLVYPGTSGASFVDYLITDAFVTPPAELTRGFTEKLVLLPNSYQVNYYGSAPERSKLWESLAARDAYGNSHDHSSINPEAFVFVNFNKIDKVEAAVFGIWMAILRRVPGSVLLLLDPSRPGGSTESSGEAKANIFREVRALGILATRIHFLPRVTKAEHLRRHAIGDLFLDTLLYGAHSTATDALYAGLPVLTLAGDSFASRVGVSLLGNSRTSELVAFSRREYEDLAVHLATHRATLNEVRRRLRASPLPPLFRTREHTQTLEAGWHAMFDVQSLTNRAWHISLARQ